MSRPVPAELLADFPEPAPVDPQLELDRVAALYKAAAVDFVLAMRWAAGYSWAVRPGKSDVRVSTGKRVPHGMYRVVRYVTQDRIEIQGLPLKPNGTTFRVELSAVEPQPLWHTAFTECGWTAWYSSGVAAGAAEKGFGRFAVQVLADCIQEHGIEGIPFFDGLDLEGYQFGEALRDLARSEAPELARLFEPVNPLSPQSYSYNRIRGHAVPYPRQFNCRCTVVPILPPVSEVAQ